MGDGGGEDSKREWVAVLRGRSRVAWGKCPMPPSRAIMWAHTFMCVKTLSLVLTSQLTSICWRRMEIGLLGTSQHGSKKEMPGLATYLNSPHRSTTCVVFFRAGRTHKGGRETAELGSARRLGCDTGQARSSPAP
jgi:hypothetical protein